MCFFFFFMQKTAYELRISDWSSDVCSSDLIDDLLARTDIVEVINARVPLKRQGKEYSARCPFHDERSPSFTVSPTKQFYHCFGCGAHGTAISFLMNYDR